jgi:hypothetical protein
MSARLCEADLMQAVQELKAEFILGLKPLPSNRFEQIDKLGALSPSSVLRRRNRALCFETANNEQARLIYPGGGQSGPTEARPIFAFLAETEQFAVNDIPLITDEQKLELVSALVVDGFLEIESYPLKQKEGKAMDDS